MSWRGGEEACSFLHYMDEMIRQKSNMRKIIPLFSITIFGWIGWWLGAHIGIMTAYLTSFVGSLFGVYVGVRINQTYLN